MAFTVSLECYSLKESPGGRGKRRFVISPQRVDAEQGIGFQGHCLMFVTAVSVLFLLKLQEYLQLSLLRTECLV